MSGEKGTGSPAPLGAGSLKQDQMLNLGNLKKPTTIADTKLTESHLEKGQNLLKEFEKDEKSGF